MTAHPLNEDDNETQAIICTTSNERVTCDALRQIVRSGEKPSNSIAPLISEKNSRFMAPKE